MAADQRPDFTWDEGLRPVHLGNVAEYNTQFGRSSLRRRDREEFRRDYQARWWADSDHYANLAMFYSPAPAVVVLPRHLDRSWTDLQARVLDRDPVDVYSGITDDLNLSSAVHCRPALRALLRGQTVFAWGRTRLTEWLLTEDLYGPRGEVPPDSDALMAARHFDSKANANALFASLTGSRADLAGRKVVMPRVTVPRVTAPSVVAPLLAAMMPGVVVPWQWASDSHRAAARIIAEMASVGETTVLKAEHGVGGHGTTVITPDLVATAGGARRLLRQLLPDDWFRRHGQVLIEQYVEGAGPYKDLTYDAVVDDDGEVRTVGTGVMIIEGTRYRGVTVGAGVVPPQLDRTIREFGHVVGESLSAQGYRGWYDVDFVADRTGQVAPTEINARLTGPTIAFAIQSRLNRVRGGHHVVRTLDHLPLGARLPEEALFDHVRRLVKACAALGVLLVPTIPTASYEEIPYLGLALAARTLGPLNAAERLIRQANKALAAPFTSRPSD